MRLTRLHLRNYRVFEDDLDLELPPGLVGIYGPNGAGKSTLLEAIAFALYGRARTAKDEIRTADVNAEGVAEVEFEHEGHLYAVRRTIAGANFTVKAQAFADGAHISEGVRDTNRYVHSVLGMDDTAFRASVFAEQKQLAAFSDTAPAERRKLVLQLLGVTPLDGARDAARKDAKMAREQVERLRTLLPDTLALEDGIASWREAVAAAGAAQAKAVEVVAAHRERLQRATAAYEALDRTGRQYELLVQQGKAARDERDGLVARLDKLAAELAGLAEAAAHLVVLRATAEGIPILETRVQALDRVFEAARVRDGVPVPDRPEPADEEGCVALREAASAAAAALATVEGESAASRAELERVREAAERSAGLSGEADCPLCGQALGASFAQVQAHRQAELAQVQARLAALETRRTEAASYAKTAARAAEEAERAAQRARTAWAAWQSAAERRAQADEALAGALLGFGGDMPTDGERQQAQAALADARRAASEAARIEGQLTRRQGAEDDLAAGRKRLHDLEATLETLRGEVKELAFSPAELDEAKSELGAARTAAEEADRLQAAADRELASATATLAGEERRLEDARQQHERLAGAADEARHLGRVADLLNAFRNSVVATVGPQLSAQAAELFGELTDHEYDRLEVDPDSYEIQIRDAGRLYGMDRFSGSETDLANLALRVAISEHVRFQSGGAVGLLVLDEVFGPLDDDRRERMLLALERLRGRFRQILVVTHASEIKEQLPAAIEVVKRPGRRATARVMGQ